MPIKSTTLLLSLLVLPFLIACGKGGASGSMELPSTSDTTDSNDSNTATTPPTDSTNISTKVAICSDLSLTGVSWPTTLNEFTVNAMALAMNISGSFEGHTGWDNITNSFDGQGLSLGLFNQNLGQGSLQPLMISLRDFKTTKFKSFFSTTQYTTMNKMLTTWGGVSTTLSKAAAADSEFDASYQDDYSDLDDMDAIINSGDVVFQKGDASNKKNQASVDWAESTLYSGTSFKADWKKSLQNMARSPEYISMQIKAANTIHKKAEGLMKTYSFTSLRSYLFFFDIVVQNGGIPASIQKKYMTWVASNKSASEVTKLKKLLEYRLTIVNPKYMSDVKSRKTSLIDGTGTVHGSNRNYGKEYCVDNWSMTYSLASLKLI